MAEPSICSLIAVALPVNAVVFAHTDPVVRAVHPALVVRVIDLFHFPFDRPASVIVLKDDAVGHLLAGSVEAEPVAEDMVAPAILVHVVQPDIQVHAAGGIVNLYVEGLGHRLRGSFEVPIVLVMVASIHVGADADVNIN